ncbi:hypothetical protein MRX96_014255 [Rhipicephalus microplus]|uniref:bublin coiled-coil protein n=1 Tax=Rhipicephalus microplus TaxID=6941 RepID=UPI002376701E
MARGNDEPKEAPKNNVEDFDINDIDQICDEECEALNEAMDKINACLDALERKNNALVQQMRQLLEKTKRSDSDPAAMEENEQV